MTARIIGIHAAIAVETDTQGEVIAQHMAIPQFRYAEPVPAAIDRTVQPGSETTAFGAAARTERIQIQIQSATRHHHGRGIVGAAKRVGCYRHGGTPTTLGLNAVTVLEVAIGRHCRSAAQHQRNA